MADISMLDTVATNDTITADHHNNQNTAITNVNAGLADAEAAAEAWGGPGGFRIFEEFMGSPTTATTGGVYPSGVVAVFSGNVAQLTAQAEAGHPGIATLDTTTGTTNYAGLFLSGQLNAAVTMKLGGGAWFLETCIKLDDLSSGGEEYDYWFGFNENITTMGANCVIFEYDRNNSANWHGVCKSGGTTTRTTTGVAVVEDAWIRLGILVNAAGTSAGFYINGTLVLTIATNIPTSAMWVSQVIQKSAGSTSRKCHVDYLDVACQLTTSR